MVRIYKISLNPLFPVKHQSPRQEITPFRGNPISGAACFDSTLKNKTG